MGIENKVEKLIVAEDYKGVDNLERVAWRESELWYEKEGTYKSSAELKEEQNSIEQQAAEKKIPEKKARIKKKFIQEKIDKRDKDNFWQEMNERLDNFSAEMLERESEYHGNIPEDIETALIKQYHKLRKDIDKHNEESEEQKKKKIEDEAKKIATI